MLWLATIGFCGSVGPRARRTDVFQFAGPTDSTSTQQLTSFRNVAFRGRDSRPSEATSFDVSSCSGRIQINYCQLTSVRQSTKSELYNSKSGLCAFCTAEPYQRCITPNMDLSFGKTKTVPSDLFKSHLSTPHA